MKTTRVPNESFVHTKAFEYGESTSTKAPASPCAVIYINDRQPQDETPANVRCISDVVADNERHPERAAFLHEARAELAAKLLSNGPTIRTMRLERGWSQTKLAEMLGTSQPHVARIERGTENLAIHTCRKLQEVLGVDMNTLDQALRHQELAYQSRATQK